MTAIKIGTGLPMTAQGPRDDGPPPVADAARRIEERGFDSVWAPDLIVGDGTPTLEAALTLATAAAVTERVKIGFGVLVVPLRPAPWLATQTATLQHLSDDRLLLGVGSGGFPSAPFWQALGVSARERGPITDATLGVLPRLLAGESVQASDEAQPLTLGPKATMPPVLVGGSERAFDRVLRFGDGWFPSLLSPADLGPAVGRVRDRASARGAPAPTVTVGSHLIMGSDDTARAAYDDLVHNLIEVHGMTPEKAAQVPMTARTPKELAEVFAAYQEAGADRIVISADNGDWMTQLDFMAEAHALVR